MSNASGHTRNCLYVVYPDLRECENHDLIQNIGMHMVKGGHQGEICRLWEASRPRLHIQKAVLVVPSRY